MIWVVVGAAIVVAGIVLFVLSRRRAPDGVTSFQRQIDALSPEARRSVVDRVQKLDEDKPEPKVPMEVDRGASDRSLVGRHERTSASE